MKTFPRTAELQVPSRDNLRRLSEPADGLRVSLYAPVPERPGFDDLRMLRGVCSAAAHTTAERLASIGASASVVSQVRDALRSIEVDPSQMPRGTRAVAALGGAEGFQIYACKSEVQPSLRVGRTYHVRPLVSSARFECRYRVLALSLDEVGLYEGGPRGLERIVTQDVPSSMNEALGLRLSEQQIQLHQAPPRPAIDSKPGKGAAIYHGHGGASDERSRDVERFHNVLAGAVRRFWNSGSDPIVLVADPAHAGRFRKVADLHGLLERTVMANPVGESALNLHARTWPVVAEWLRASEIAQLAAAEDRLAHGKVVSSLEEAASAALQGRVERLWLHADARVPGYLDPLDGSVHEPIGAEDALDALLAMVLARGGDAVMWDDALPGGTSLLAELRG